MLLPSHRSSVVCYTQKFFSPFDSKANSTFSLWWKAQLKSGNIFREKIINKYIYMLSCVKYMLYDNIVLYIIFYILYIICNWYGWAFLEKILINIHYILHIYTIWNHWKEIKKRLKREISLLILYNGLVLLWISIFSRVTLTNHLWPVRSHQLPICTFYGCVKCLISRSQFSLHMWDDTDSHTSTSLLGTGYISAYQRQEFCHPAAILLLPHQIHEGPKAFFKPNDLMNPLAFPINWTP